MDSYLHLEQAFKQIKENNIDLIICCGDLFDVKEPSLDEIYEAIRLLNKVEIDNNINLKIEDKKLKIPLITIIGNHENRGKDHKSPVHLLEEMGFLKLLHCSNICLEEEKVYVQGMSGVPEKYAKDVFEKWNPAPKENYYNILLLHQTIKEYVPIDDEMTATISLSNLPKDFDLVANGHLHWSDKKQLNEKTTFILPGSTITTQQKKIESDQKKGFFIVDTITKEITFENIKNTRPSFYEEISLSETNIEDIEKKIKQTIENVLTKDISKKPLIRIKIKGTLTDGETIKELNLLSLEKKYPDVYLSFNNKLQEKTIKDNIQKLRELKSQNKDISEMSKEIFLETISQIKKDDFDYERLYTILKNNDLKKAKELVYEEID
jgi:DNA repair exonuclease SbcCD nuclease subunit